MFKCEITKQAGMNLVHRNFTCTIIFMLYVVFILQLSSTIRLRNRRQAVRIILKELESLSFDIASDDVIKKLQDALHTIKVKYQKKC